MSIPSGGGSPTYYLAKFPEKCAKMKKFWWRGDAYPCVPFPGSTNGWGPGRILRELPFLPDPLCEVVPLHYGIVPQ